MRDATNSVAVRLQAVRSLSEGGGRGAAARIAAFLVDPSPRVRDLAAWALSNADGRRYARALVPLLADRDVFRKLSGRAVPARRADSLETWLARVRRWGVRCGADSEGRNWMRRKLIRFRRVDAYDPYKHRRQHEPRRGAPREPGAKPLEPCETVVWKP